MEHFDPLEESFIIANYKFHYMHNVRSSICT